MCASRLRPLGPSASIRRFVKTVAATRYVTPLREGGSLPAIVDASDAGQYVLKFRGAGQGVRTLIAEAVCAEVGRSLGLRVPELALIEVDRALGRNEPDSEIRELLRKSVGLNVGLDYLPGSVTFDPTVGPAPSTEEASEIVWFDAFITNVDRTPRNPNLLCWHRALYLIDHGAALYFHHDWRDVETKARTPFTAIRDHVLLPWAKDLASADRRLRPRLSRGVFEGILASLPDDWFAGDPPQDQRAAYVDYLAWRLEAADHFVEEAARAHAQLV